MDYTKTDELLRKVQEFENTLLDALKGKYKDWDSEIARSLIGFSPVTKWNLVDFYHSYIEGATYPEDRLERVMYYLFDIKLQLYFLLEVDLGLYNRLVHDRGYDKAKPAEVPHIHLTRMSLDQGLIGKTRILWERIMNFVYYLEKGQRLENKVSGKKSKRREFFDFIASTNTWKFMEPYGALIQQYDDSFRTPEYHKSSVLRPELFGGTAIDPNKLLEPLNKAINNLWENTMAIIKGGRAYSFCELHLDENGNIKQEFLEE